MKRVIGYTRISTSDQSNFSLDGQEDYIRNYCGKLGYELLALFREDGQSAKNFQRDEWQQLEKFIKQNYREIDYLVVAKYDRFSRNMGEALQVISRFETEYKIVILSAMEDMKVSPKSSMFNLMRMQMLLYADNELRVIKERTKEGMHRGAVQGRFLAAAPFGYINKRDAAKLPIIVVDETKRFIVKKAFDMVIAGVPLEAIRKELKTLGCNRASKPAMRYMLSNPTYAGMVRVPQHNDEPEYLTPGLHEAIIDKGTYYRAQEILSGRGISRKTLDETVPLRGILMCEQCFRAVTASASKGRNAYYTYYRCHHCTSCKSYRADKLHAQFDEILKILSLSPIQRQAIRELTEKRIDIKMTDTRAELEAKRRALRDADNKLVRLQEKYILDDIPRDEYKRHQAKWLHDKYLLEAAVADLETPVNEIWKRVTEFLPRLGDLCYWYNMGEVHQKQAFVQIGFQRQLTYSGESFGTTFLLPLFQPKAALLKEKGLLNYSNPLQISTVSGIGSPFRT